MTDPVADTASKKIFLNPLDLKQNPDSSVNTDIVKNIISNETNTNDEKLLDNAPEVDLSLLDELQPKKNWILLGLKVLLGILITITVASFIFLAWQLTGAFDYWNQRFNLVNMAKDVSSTNAELIQLKTNLNYYKYLEAKGFLDEFSYYGDAYLQNYEVSQSQTASASEKAAAIKQLADLKVKLKDSFVNAQKNFSLNISVPLMKDPTKKETTTQDSLFENQLASKLNAKMTESASSQDLEAKREADNYKYAINLVKNSTLNELLSKTDFSTLSDAQIYDLIKNLNSSVTSNMSILSKLKEARIKWSDIMNEISLRTAAVDTHYSEDFYDVLGGIRYTSYDFDAEKKAISIIGELKRFDTINFTMLTNLVEEINRSKLFGDAEMRQFSKSGSVSEGYTSSIRLSVKLK